MLGDVVPDLGSFEVALRVLEFGPQGYTSGLALFGLVCKMGHTDLQTDTALWSVLHALDCRFGLYYKFHN